MNTKFYTFIQNNSGGYFVTDLKNGIAEIVIIEAKDSKEANSKAEEIGLYFNGCDSGLDCSCCGDRWYPTYEEDGEAKPLVYGQDALNYKGGVFQKNIFIYYIDKPFVLINNN